MVPELLSIISTLLGGLIGFLSAWLMWRTQTQYQRHNLARAFLLEIAHLKEQLDVFANAFESLRAHHGYRGRFDIKFPIYDNNRLYYATQKEIAAFEPKLAEALYRFYMDLIAIERMRLLEPNDQFFAPSRDILEDRILKAREAAANLERLLVRETT